MERWFVVAIERVIWIAFVCLIVGEIANGKMNYLLFVGLALVAIGEVYPESNYFMERWFVVAIERVIWIAFVCLIVGEISDGKMNYLLFVGLALVAIGEVYPERKYFVLIYSIFCFLSSSSIIFIGRYIMGSKTFLESFLGAIGFGIFVVVGVLYIRRYARFKNKTY